MNNQHNIFLMESLESESFNIVTKEDAENVLPKLIQRTELMRTRVSKINDYLQQTFQNKK